MSNPLTRYIETLVDERMTANQTGQHDLTAAIDDYLRDSGQYVVGTGHRYETIQEAVDAAPEESSEIDPKSERHATYGDPKYEPAAEILVTNEYDSQDCGETFPIDITKKQVHVRGVARGGARIVGNGKDPIFDVQGVGSYDYRNVRTFENLRTYRGNPVFRAHSDNGLVVRNCVLQGPVRGVEIWEGPDDHIDSVMNRFENVHLWWPQDDAFVLKPEAACNATHLQGCWVHGAGDDGTGAGVKVHGAACTISQSVFEGLGGKAIKTNNALALGLFGNYFEANYKNGAGRPVDIELNGISSFTAISNYFNSAGRTVCGIDARQIEAPVIIGNLFNKYQNAEFEGEEGYGIRLHEAAPNACVMGNVAYGGYMRDQPRSHVIGKDECATTWEVNNLDENSS